ncbi:MAG: hypothetical protein NZ601_06315 [candidate division WOR-3 bacterium]|nr:hypothetical protein [candidate division WOR-3 bacterium]MCX7757081.1 hypothetical protein [candidate division WOR-3 bacterium]MDW7987571.1 hypothetical protein [candidate division WOR-3 bacterium]
MPVIYLKSGGYIECEGYTIKEGCVRAIGGTLKETREVQESSKYPEVIIPLGNILFIVPQKLT